MENITIVIVIALVTLLSFIFVWLNLPGTFLLFLATIAIAYYTGFELISREMLYGFFAICLALELIEFLIGALMVKFFGGSTEASVMSVVGAVVGAIVGSFIFPVIGSVIGLFVGSYLLTYITEKNKGKTAQQASEIAISATIGNILGKGIKSISVVFVGVYLSYIFL